MMIKIICLFAIILLSVLLGYIKTSELSATHNSIKYLIDALTMLEFEIKNKNSMLFEAFSECAQADRTGVFKELAHISETDGDYSKMNAVFAQKIKDVKTRSVLFSFANGLKTEDTNGQVANIKNCRERLALIYSEMGLGLDKLKKIYFMSFVLAGTAVAILFI